MNFIKHLKAEIKKRMNPLRPDPVVRCSDLLNWIDIATKKDQEDWKKEQAEGRKNLEENKDE